MIETYSVVVAQSELIVVYDSLNAFKKPTGNLGDKFYLFEIPVYPHQNAEIKVLFFGNTMVAFLTGSCIMEP